MNGTAQLYDLQKIDVTWEKVRRRLLTIQKLTGETEAVKAARACVEETEGDRHRWHAQQADAELESQSLAARILSAENTLMSGKVRNPKELEALQASAESLRRQRDLVEAKGVDALLQVDELNQQLSAQRAELASVEREWQHSQSGLQEEDLKLRRTFLGLKKKREELVHALPVDLLAQYEDLRRRKAGVAVAAIEQGTCGACHVRVPSGVVSAARGATDLVLCPSCGRILHAP